MKGCTYIHHVASPLPVEIPKHEEELIRPAVEGAVNVLKAAAAAGTVKRVVMTSSMVAVAGKYRYFTAMFVLLGGERGSNKGKTSDCDTSRLGIFQGLHVTDCRR